jgi:hypothetical protein
MGEEQTLLTKTINYTGLISVQGLYKAIMNDLSSKDYGPYEEKHTEQVFEDGKQIQIAIKGAKKLSDMAEIKWECDLEFGKCEEVVVEKEGREVKMYKGTVHVKNHLLLATNMDKTFEQNSFMYFLRVIMDKYVFKSYINRGISKAKTDYALFEQTIKSFLNFEKIR